MRLPVDHVVATGIVLLAGGVFSAVPGVQPAWADSAPTVRLEPPAMDGSLQNMPANGEPGASTIAKKLQNPIGDLISFPIQSNTNFGYGPHHGTQEIVNIQPVVPFHLNSRWNLITRAILPLVWQPSLQPTQTVPFGTGPITFSAFLSPAQPSHGWLWGLGPVIQIPTTSDSSLGSNLWGGGITGVVVFMAGPWVTGALVNNVWSVGGTNGPRGTRYDNFLLQPFVNYNFDNGWYVGSAPIITANWLTAGDNAWTLPIGGQFGRVVKLGTAPPINLQLGAYYNTRRPHIGPVWQIRAQVTVVF